MPKYYIKLTGCYGIY